MSMISPSHDSYDLLQIVPKSRDLRTACDSLWSGGGDQQSRDYF